jgi:hypothetical protein
MIAEGLVLHVAKNLRDHESAARGSRARWHTMAL